MPNQYRLQSIQMIRGLAAVSVVIDHAMTRHGFSLTSHESVFWQFGSFGVVVFFAISGFVMLHSLAGFPNGWPGSLDFLERRLKRIAPLYWIATLLALLLALQHATSIHLSDIVKSLLFIAAPSVQDGDLFRPILGVGWTLIYEMFFYLIFALAMLLPRRLTGFAVLAALVVVVGLGVMVRDPAYVGEPTTAFQYYSHPIILLFGAGIVIGLLRARVQWEWFGPMTAAFAYVLALGIVVALFVAGGAPADIPLAMKYTFWALAVACVLVATMEVRQDRPDRFVGLVEHFGNASYSVYLFHQFTFSVTSRALTLVWPKAPAFVQASVLVIGACAFGSLAHVVIEKPLMRALKNLHLLRPAPRLGRAQSPAA